MKYILKGSSQGCYNDSIVEWMPIWLIKLFWGQGEGAETYLSVNFGEEGELQDYTAKP